MKIVYLVISVKTGLRSVLTEYLDDSDACTTEVREVYTSYMHLISPCLYRGFGSDISVRGVVIGHQLETRFVSIGRSYTATTKSTNGRVLHQWIL